MHPLTAQGQRVGQAIIPIRRGGPSSDDRDRKEAHAGTATGGEWALVAQWRCSVDPAPLSLKRGRVFDSPRGSLVAGLPTLVANLRRAFEDALEANALGALYDLREFVGIQHRRASAPRRGRIGEVLALEYNHPDGQSRGASFYAKGNECAGLHGERLGGRERDLVPIQEPFLPLGEVCGRIGKVDRGREAPCHASPMHPSPTG